MLASIQILLKRGSTHAYELDGTLNDVGMVVSYIYKELDLIVLEVVLLMLNLEL